MDVAFSNLIDMTGSNVTAVYWENDVVNRDGLASHNCGVTLITSRRGQAVRVQDFLFDTGEKFRAAWGEGKRKE